MPKNFLYVRRELLLAVAGLIWIFAGAGVVRIGWPNLLAPGYVPLSAILTAGLIFLVFTRFIFSGLVRRHTERIGNLPALSPLYRFFDRKSYLIMALMIGMGYGLRASEILAAPWLGALYLGIGTALIVAGLMFLRQYGAARKALQGAP